MTRRAKVTRLAWIGSGGIVALTVIAAVVISLATGDVGTSVGLSLAGGALLLAAVAALAATVAYAESVRAPSLTWEITGRLVDAQSRIPLRDTPPPIAFGGDVNPPDAVLRFHGNADDSVLRLRITNNGDATARNILSTLTFTGMSVFAGSNFPGGQTTPTRTDTRRR